MNYRKLAITYIDREWLVWSNKSLAQNKFFFVALLKRSSFIIPDIAREARHYPPGRCPFLRQTTLQFLFIVFWPGGWHDSASKALWPSFYTGVILFNAEPQGEVQRESRLSSLILLAISCKKKDHENLFPVGMTSLYQQNASQNLSEPVCEEENACIVSRGVQRQM